MTDRRHIIEERPDESHEEGEPVAGHNQPASPTIEIQGPIVRPRAALGLVRWY